MKARKLFIVTLGILTALVAGCSQNLMKCAYQPGEVEQAKISTDEINKVWVSMPDEDPTKPQLKETKKEIVYTAEVESVDEKGNAILNVTLDKVKVYLKSDVRDKNVENEYYSDGTEFRSTWKNEPELAGKSYQVKLAPDTSVLDIMGLEELRKELNLVRDEPGIIAGLLQDDHIKSIHQRKFLQHLPENIKFGKQYDVNIKLPDDMIKAKAVKKIYTVNPPQKSDDADVIPVTAEAEPLFVLPVGVEETPEPTRFDKNLIKSMSNMNEFSITEHNLFDMTNQKVLKASEMIDFTLLILGKDIGMAAGQTAQKNMKDNGGEMYTVIQIDTSYERLN